MRIRPPRRVSSVLQKAGNWEDFPILFIGACATVGAHWLWGTTGMGGYTLRNSDIGAGRVYGRLRSLRGQRHGIGHSMGGKEEEGNSY